MAAAIYVLCAVASAGCSSTLVLSYFDDRRRATRLVLWSGLCFAWLAVSNLLMVVDLVVLPEPHLSVARAATACLGALTLLAGLILEVR